MNSLTVIATLLLGAPPADPVHPAAADELGISSVLDFIMKGGWPMIPIALCSLAALTVVVERSVVLARGRVIPRGFVERLRETSGDRSQAAALCRERPSAMARVIEAGLRHADEPAERREKMMEEAGHREVVVLRQRMRLLSALPQVATMLGLLGTVFGMIKTFQAIALSSEALGRTEMLAKGIFEAWTCTAAGLLVAIPVLVAYHWLMGRIDGLVNAIDAAATDWFESDRGSTAAGVRSKAGSGASLRAADQPPRDRNEIAAGAA